MLLNKIKKQINSHNIISFDIFDTLLLRPYCNPTDLFHHLELQEKSPFFAIARINAEQKARQNHKGQEDITFDDIYNEIETIYQSMKDKELSLEMQVLTANPEMFEVFNYALKKKKKIIIVSDMYLPENFIEKLLKKNGYIDYDKLYLSSKLLKTKSSTSLYKYILDDLSVKPSTILHIGDNKKSDFKNAIKCQIKAIFYKQITKQFLEQNNSVKMFHKENTKTLGSSILISLMAWRWQKIRMGLISDDYWSEIGYKYAGPTCYGYTRFIEAEALKNEIKNLFFVARDGFTLHKVFQTFNKDIKTEYVYAPRFLNFICRLDYEKDNSKQAHIIIDYFKNKDSAFKKLVNKANFEKQSPHDFIQKNSHILGQLASIEMKNYQNYLNSKNNNDQKIGLVDTITYAYSSQKLIQSTLSKNEVIGFYWGVLKSPFKGLFKNITFSTDNNLSQNNNRVFTKNWNFMEFLMTSPEYPIQNLSPTGKPMYLENVSDFEKSRSLIYPEVSKAAIEFSEDVKKAFGHYNIFLQASDLVNWINCFIDNPTHIDIIKMAKIWHAADGDHKKYNPLFSCKIKWMDIFLHPKSSIKNIKASVWRTSLQNLALCFLSPISIKFHFPKRIEIFLFPKLSKRYIILAINLSKRCYYRIILGSKKEDI